MGGVGGIGGAGIGGDACINETDLDIIGMTVPNLRWQAAVCGAACVGSMNDETLFLGCVDSCIQEDVPGLSLECTSCYGELAWCAGADCNKGCTNPIVNICAPDCTADSLLCPGTALASPSSTGARGATLWIASTTPSGKPESDPWGVPG